MTIPGSLEASWPTPDEAWVDHVTWCGPHALDRADHDDAVHQLRRAHGAGDAATRAWAAARLSLRLCPPASGEAPRPVVDVATDEDLARIALDHEPDAGGDAPFALLGDVAAHLPASHPLWLVAVAWSAALVFPGSDHPPVRAWSLDLKRRHGDRRDRVLAATRAPPVPFRLVSGDGGLHLSPRVPVNPGWVPAGPVCLDAVPCTCGAPAPGRLLWARVVPTTSGPVLRTALITPDLPDRTWLGAWRDAVTPEVLIGRALRSEDLLRRAAHHLVARCVSGR